MLRQSPITLTTQLFWCQNDTLVLLALDDLERVEEMLLAVLNGC